MNKKQSREKQHGSYKSGTLQKHCLNESARKKGRKLANKGVFIAAEA